MAYGFNDDKSKAAMPVLKSDIQLSNTADEKLFDFLTRVYNAAKDVKNNISYIEINGGSQGALFFGIYYIEQRSQNGFAMTRTYLTQSNSSGVYRPNPNIHMLYCSNNAATNNAIKFEGFDTSGLPTGTIYDNTYTIPYANVMNVTVYYWDNI